MATSEKRVPSKKVKKIFNFFRQGYQSTRFRVFSRYSDPAGRKASGPGKGGTVSVLLLMTELIVIFVFEGCRRDLSGASGQTALWFDKSDYCPVILETSGTERCKKLIYILFPATPLLSRQESKIYEKNFGCGIQSESICYQLFFKKTQSGYALLRSRIYYSIISSPFFPSIHTPSLISFS